MSIKLFYDYNIRAAEIKAVSIFCSLYKTACREAITFVCLCRLA